MKKNTGMTVKELIKELKACDPDATIGVSVDVSVGEDDWEHRAFGDEVLGIQNELSSKEVVILSTGYLNFNT